MILLNPLTIVYLHPHTPRLRKVLEQKSVCLVTSPLIANVSVKFIEK